MDRHLSSYSTFRSNISRRTLFKGDRSSFDLTLAGISITVDITHTARTSSVVLVHKSTQTTPDREIISDLKR
jgi:hypothetical protein